MALKIGEEQYKAIEVETIRRQLKEIVSGYADEIESEDPDLAKRIRSLDKETCLALFKDIYNLTSDPYYQKALLALIVSTGVNIFRADEFSYIMNHPFLCGDAKARHIVLSSLSILKKP